MSSSSRHIKLLASTELEKPKEAQGRIPNKIPYTGMTVLFGPPKCGKSFLALDWACRIVTGTSYRGLAVRQGPVLYLAQEGQAGFWARKEAWFRRYGRSPYEDQLKFIMSPIKFNREQTKNPVSSEVIQSIKLEKFEPVLVIVDTLARSLDGNENETPHMQFFVDSVDKIARYFQCASLVVHHTGKVGSDPRGSTALTAACDSLILVGKRKEPGTIRYRVEYMKDGPGEDDWNTSRLHTVEVDEHTSCYVEQSVAKEKYTEAERQETEGQMFTPQLRTMMGIARQLREKEMNGEEDITKVHFELQDFKEVCIRTDGLFRRGTRDLEARVKSFRNRLERLVEMDLLEFVDNTKLRITKES